MKRDFCETCRWFVLFEWPERKKNEPALGNCHHTPPIYVPFRPPTATPFPYVKLDDFCSAHAPIDPEPEAVEQGVKVDALAESNIADAEDWRDRLGLRGAIG